MCIFIYIHIFIYREPHRAMLRPIREVRVRKLLEARPEPILTFEVKLPQGKGSPRIPRPRDS